LSHVISVAACGNGSGKTTLMESILRALPGRLAAIKFTTVFRDGVNCPKSEVSCACRELHGAFTIVRDAARIGMDGTDTGRMTRAGAAAVWWCLARPGAHREAWDHLRRDVLPAGQECLVEGNSAVSTLTPDRLLVILTPRLPRPRWKPDAWDLAGRADHLLINPWGAASEEIAALAAEVEERIGRPPLVQDPAVPLPEWPDPGLSRDLAALLGLAVGA
jgi:hypothetical protein